MTTADDVRKAAGIRAKHPALAVQCPHCRAAVDEHCHGLTPSTRAKKRDPHPGRLAAAPSAVIIPFPQRPSPAA